MPKSQTKQHMIMTTIDLFHRQGVNATSIDQILEISGTGKSQFTHYFKNKDGLILAALITLREMIQSGQASTGYEIKSWKEMNNWFENYIVFQKTVECTRSCPIGTISADLEEEKGPLRDEVRVFLTWSREKLASFFESKKKKGELSKTVRSIELADFCIALMQGGMLLSKMDRRTDMFENAAKQALNYIKMLRK